MFIPSCEPSIQNALNDHLKLLLAYTGAGLCSEPPWDPVSCWPWNLCLLNPKQWMRNTFRVDLQVMCTWNPTMRSYLGWLLHCSNTFRLICAVWRIRCQSIHKKEYTRIIICITSCTHRKQYSISTKYQLTGKKTPQKPNFCLLPFKQESTFSSCLLSWTRDMKYLAGALGLCFLLWRAFLGRKQAQHAIVSNISSASSTPSWTWQVHYKN